ncbi:MAG: hypothetical protein HZC36_13880 [Armatimonadetes bacterium]|nr:hypothetical protein [Armatimonadota bacterium]
MPVYRILLFAFAVGFWAVALAVPAFIKDFRSTYGIKPESRIAKAGCGFCHTTKAAKLNPYGADLKKAMTQENTKVLTGSVLKKIEGLDSDKDGAKNSVEISSDTLPGDPKSK